MYFCSDATPWKLRQTLPRWQPGNRNHTLMQRGQSTQLTSQVWKWLFLHLNKVTLARNITHKLKMFCFLIWLSQGYSRIRVLGVLSSQWATSATNWTVIHPFFLTRGEKTCIVVLFSALWTWEKRSIWGVAESWLEKEWKIFSYFMYNSQLVKQKKPKKKEAERSI